jgi:hypothetical protein
MRSSALPGVESGFTELGGWYSRTVAALTSL